MRRLPGISIVAALSLAAPAPTWQAPPYGPAASPGHLREAFTRAAGEYGVPENVLLAVSYLESRWDVNGGLPSVAGGYGPMHLVDGRAV
ncbi:N-acetylmuramoyl-L-alanine amidase, partial [Streptosporangium algeriense]